MSTKFADKLQTLRSQHLVVNADVSRQLQDCQMSLDGLHLSASDSVNHCRMPYETDVKFLTI